MYVLKVVRATFLIANSDNSTINSISANSDSFRRAFRCDSDVHRPRPE